VCAYDSCIAERTQVALTTSTQSPPPATRTTQPRSDGEPPGNTAQRSSGHLAVIGLYAAYATWRCSYCVASTISAALPSQLQARAGASAVTRCPLTPQRLIGSVRISQFSSPARTHARTHSTRGSFCETTPRHEGIERCKPPPEGELAPTEISCYFAHPVPSPGACDKIRSGYAATREMQPLDGKVTAGTQCHPRQRLMMLYGQV
jgi:hypothetical protein